MLEVPVMDRSEPGLKADTHQTRHTVKLQRLFALITLHHQRSFETGFFYTQASISIMPQLNRMLKRLPV